MTQDDVARKIDEEFGDPFAADIDGQANDAWLRPKAPTGTLKWAAERVLEMAGGVASGATLDVVEVLFILAAILKALGQEGMAARLDEEGQSVVIDPRYKGDSIGGLQSEAVVEIAWRTLPQGERCPVTSRTSHRDVAIFTVGYHRYQPPIGMGPGRVPLEAWQLSDVEEMRFTADVVYTVMEHAIRRFTQDVMEDYHLSAQADNYEYIPEPDE